MASDNLATKISIATYIGNGNGRSVNDIAEHFGISVRTVYRYLDRLQEEGYPLTNEERGNGREKLWTMLEVHSDRYGNALPSASFSQEERILLYYVMAELKKSEDMLPSFKSVRNKLASMLSQKSVAFPSLDYAQNITRKLFPIESISSISKLASKETQLVVRHLLKAISEQSRVFMKYHVPNKTGALEVKDISPVFAFFYDGGMYLQALLEDGALRTYAIERIENVSLIKGSIAVKPDFDPHILLTDPFGPFIGKEKIEAEVRISKEQVQYVKEKNWPSSVSISDNPDGSATFCVTTYGEHEFIRWLLSQKSSVVLLKPEWLRNKLKATIDEMAVLYS